jgi:hypothetical protein
MSATTCSRDVKTKSIWLPGRFTIWTLGSSRLHYDQGSGGRSRHGPALLCNQLNPSVD